MKPELVDKLSWVGNPSAPQTASERRDQARLLMEIVGFHGPLLSTLKALVARGWKSRALMEHPSDSDFFFQLARAQQLIERIDSSPRLKMLEPNPPPVIIRGAKVGRR